VSIRTQEQYVCPIDVTLSVMSGKWKPLILFHLKSAPQRFSVLQHKIPGISHKVLTQQLRALESNGLITRARIQNEQTEAYELTAFGRTLRPSLAALANWGQKHHAELGVRLVWRP
jgi:DNA-binding HxlR family transcriptional regulator